MQKVSVFISVSWKKCHSIPIDTYLKGEPPASLKEGIFFLCRDDDNSNISLYYEHLLSARQYKNFAQVNLMFSITIISLIL